MTMERGRVTAVLILRGGATQPTTLHRLADAPVGRKDQLMTARGATKPGRMGAGGLNRAKLFGLVSIVCALLACGDDAPSNVAGGTAGAPTSTASGAGGAAGGAGATGGTGATSTSGPTTGAGATGNVGGHPGGAGGVGGALVDAVAPTELNSAHGRMSGPTYELRFQLGRALHQPAAAGATQELVCAAPTLASP